jgi:uncharacterized integral membrane protein (TIGR00698 family)
MSRPAGSFADYWSRVSVSFKGVWPGLALTAMVAAAADFVSSTYGGPVMLLALLMGMALNFTTEQERVAAGVTFASKKILRIGVALLGLRITFADVVALGAQTVELVTAGVVVTILFGVLTARLLGKDRSFGVLVGGATAICGASAALAISSMLPRKADSGNDVIFTVVAVTAFSTAAMVIYPALFSALGFADREIGVLIGATIHDVAQVVGAGYAVSQEAGDTATVVKLFRVALLLPTVLVISVLYASRRNGKSSGFMSLVPLFAIVFAVLVVVGSWGMVPAGVKYIVNDVSRGCLVVAVAAIGLSTSLRSVARVGFGPVLLAGLTTLLLLVFCLLAIGYGF